ncbi:hypothetical protein BH11BAC4_BH11BAC4_21290 [soil metagenome]
MKKIRSIQELKTLKKQLEQRKHELEKSIQYDWRDVKESLQPVNMAKQVFRNVFTLKEKSVSKPGVFSKIVALFTGRKNKREDL